jgi:uncharacterized protein YcfL
MKKLFFATLVLGSLVLSSCGSKTTEETAVITVDSTVVAVDTTVVAVDTTVVDTTK